MWWRVGGFGSIGYKVLIDVDFSRDDTVVYSKTAFGIGYLLMTRKTISKIEAGYCSALEQFKS